MKSFARALVVVAALCGAGTVAAQDPQWYAGVAGGRFWPGTSTNGPKKVLDPGPIGELRIGLRVPTGMALEVAIGAFHVEGDMPPVDVSETELQTLSARWLTTTFKGWHRLGHDRLRAFAGLGVSCYWFDAGLKDPPSTRRDETETDIGVHLVGGAEFDVMPRIVLGIEYRRLSVEPTERLFGGNAAVYSADGNTALLTVASRF